MANIFLALLIACLTVAYVKPLRELHKTKGVTAMDTFIAGYEGIHGLDELACRLGLDPPFSLRRENSRHISRCLTKHRLRVMYDGVPVRVFTLQATSDENDYFIGPVTGYIPTIVDLDTSPSRKKKDIKKAVANFVNNENIRINIGDISSKDLEDFTSFKQIHVDLDTGVPSLAYYVESVVDIATYPRNPKVLLDACTLDVINGGVYVRNGNDKITNECPNIRGGNEKYAGDIYGSSPGEVCIHAKVKGKNCELSNDFVTIKTVKNGYDRKKAKTVKFKCDEGPDDAANGAFSPSADAYYYSRLFYNMMQSWVQLAETGKEPITLYTHYGVQFDNSFWDGRSVTFGDGSDIVFPFVTREIVAHELCHGLTDYLNNLNFDGESIAMDEAFSDICGLALGLYTSGVNDWSFAPDVVKQEGLSLRYFDDPTKDGFTIAHVKDWNEHLDPYQGLGILTKFFYNVVQEQGIEFRDAFETVVHANIIYWNEETSFLDGACGVTRAASDLGLDTNAFVRAFHDVGINLDFCVVNCTSNLDFLDFFFG